MYEIFWERVRLRPKTWFDDDSFYWKALFGRAGVEIMLDDRVHFSISNFSARWSMQVKVTFIDSSHSINKLEMETIK